MIRQRAAKADQDKVATPVTVRTLETIIRLATAHAKLRQSRSVVVEDIDEALKMVTESIFGEKKTEEVQDDPSADAEMEDLSNEPVPSKSRSSRAAANVKRERPADEPTIAESASKKMKTDHDLQVAALMSAKTEFQHADTH